MLRLAVGNPVTAKFVLGPLSLRTEEDAIPYAQVWAEMVEELQVESLITPEGLSSLKEKALLGIKERNQGSHYFGDGVDSFRNYGLSLSSIEGKNPDSNFLGDELIIMPVN